MAIVTATTDDLTTMQVDVVVNAANEGLQHGGGVAAALARAGGPVVQAESDDWVATKGPIGFGRAGITTAGAMPARHVVHVVGPRWADRPEDPDHLAAAVLAALDAAVGLDASSIAIPVISAGIFGYPQEQAARVIAVTARTWASAHDDDIAISLVGVDLEATRALAAGLAHDPLSSWPASAPERRDRPAVPDGYGVPDGGEGLQHWATAEAKLARADTVWLATTRPDGRPHVVPRWGVWLDNQFFYDGAPSTRHVRNLVAGGTGAGPAVLHLESGTDVVIVNGSSGPTTPPTTWLTVQLVAAFHAKYKPQGYAPSLDAWSGEAAGGLCRFVPQDALAWANFPTDMTRWRF